MTTFVFFSVQSQVLKTFIYLFIYGCIGPAAWAFFSCSEQGLPLGCSGRLLIVIASLVAQQHSLHGLWASVTVVQTQKQFLALEHLGLVVRHNKDQGQVS